MLTESTLQGSASNKVFAKLVMLDLDIERLRSELKCEITGAITIEQLTALYEGTLKEQKVWNYIAETLEKSNI